MSEISDHIDTILSQGPAIDWRVEEGEGDGFRIERIDEGWRVVGRNERSCLWGVLHVQDTDAKSMGTQAPTSHPQTYQPRFAIRGINPCESLLRHTPDQVRSLLDRMAHWRMNRLILHVAYGYQTYGPLIESLCRARGIDIVYYIQTGLLFLEGVDPQLFARDEQGRPRTPQLENRTRLCASQPKALEAFRAGARRYFTSDAVPRRAKLLLMDADGYLICHCPSCRALGPTEQWMAFFTIALEEAHRCDKHLEISYLSYVWRYNPPRGVEALGQVDMVMFDTHQRCRWAPMGEEHAQSVFNELEGQSDPRAATMALNRYLLDRLREWRQQYRGDLVVFENLMIQGSLSCPQPYTASLLQDWHIYEREGVDGVILEAFEPGINSFEGQINTLSRAMWSSDALTYQATALEFACLERLRWHAGQRFNYKNLFNVLEYLTTDQFDGLDLLVDASSDRVLISYARRLRRFLLSRQWRDAVQTIQFAMNHQERLDWVMISFNLLRAVEPSIAVDALNDEERQFMKADKLWDWMEVRNDPLASARRVVNNILSSTR